MRTKEIRDCSTTGFARLGPRRWQMAARRTVSARTRARAARAKLEEQRAAQIEAVDARVADYFEAADARDAAEDEVQAALVRLEQCGQARRDRLVDVLEVEPDVETVVALTGATKTEVNEAKRARRSKRAAAKPDEAPAPAPAPAPAAESEPRPSHTEVLSTSPRRSEPAA